MQPPAYSFADEPRQIAAALASVSAATEVALDFEADSLHSYREKICLAQLSSRADNWVVDTLRGGAALDGLFALVENPDVRKVMHGADYDIRLLKKDRGAALHNLFDTMIAARFAGRDQFGLAALLEQEFGVRLDKKHQKADWSARPLGRELLDYAALDTAYLLPLKDRLEAELTALGRLHWATEEFALLEAATPALERPPHCLDVKGAGRLPPPSLAVLQQLVELRDAVARERDRPPFKVLSNAVLLAWAEDPPRSRTALGKTSGANPRLLRQLGEQILAAVEAGRAVPEEAWPRVPSFTPNPLDEDQERRLRRLKKLRLKRAGDLNLDPGFLINNNVLESLARLPPAQVAESLPTELKNWQQEALGEDVIRTLA